MFSDKLYVDELNIESLPIGGIHDLSINICHDGLGATISVPVIVARGAKKGPVFGITAAVHGNELNGIPVIHHLMANINVQNLRGTVVALPVVNIPGYHNEERYFNHKDLNSLMPGVERGPTQRVYVYRIIQKIVRHFDILVDLHTASFGRINSLYVRADMTDEITAKMAYLQRPQIIVHNPPSDRTIRGAAQSLGIPAITVEIGNPQRFQRDFIRRSIVGLKAVLAQHKLIAKRTISMGAAPVLCEKSFWIYTDHGGILEVFPDVNERVEKDQIIAKLTDIYGHVTRQFKAPANGVVVGKSVNPVSPTGARILHLGLIADEQKQQFCPRPEFGTKRQKPQSA